MKNRNKQSGQSLILVTIFLGIMSLSVFMVFNAGMLSQERVSLQNTADAAAYSSAVLVARDLNFQAYTNRAMVANQIAMAQYVGLSSWIKMLAIATENLDTYFGWIPIVGYIIGIVDAVMAAVDQVAQPVLEGMTTITDFYTQALSKGQEVFRYGMFGSSIFVIYDVVKINDPDINFSAASQSLFAVDSAKIWYSFTSRIDTESNNDFDEERREEFHKVTNDSRDRFTSRRTYDWMRVEEPLLTKWRVEKAGGSDLIDTDNQETWTAMDTVSLTIRSRICHFHGWNFKCDWHDGPEIPFGYASTTAGDDYNLRRNNSLWGSSWGINRTGSGLASGEKEEWDDNTYSGLQNFYDIEIEGYLDSAPSVRVVLAKSDSDIRTSDNTKSEVDGELVNWGTGSLDIEKNSQFARNAMSTIGKAEAYFKRPNDHSFMSRNDSRYEYANLYSPYWQARLIDTTSSDRALAIGIINAL